MSLKITCLGQGSKGNCWIADYHGELLLIDAGLSIKTIKKGIDYNLVAVQGVLVTHNHRDHSMAVEDLQNCGIPMFIPFAVSQRKRTLGHYQVRAFSVPHGDCECFGFLIEIAGYRFIYATDLELIPYTFKTWGLNTIIVECNYQDEYIDKEADNFQHKALDHAELKTTVGIVEANLTDNLQNVIITHMGETSCNAIECCDAIRAVVPETVNVDYARAGETWILIP